jgi:hypothetical protein
VALVRERTTPIERPPVVDEDSANFLRIEGYRVVSETIPTAVHSVSRPEIKFNAPIIEMNYEQL